MRLASGGQEVLNRPTCLALQAQTSFVCRATDPDTAYRIITDPDNARMFRNIEGVSQHSGIMRSQHAVANAEQQTAACRCAAQTGHMLAH